MSNLYKLTKKCATLVLQRVVEDKALLSENQISTVREIEGTKEQALANIMINKAHGNEL